LNVVCAVLGQAANATASVQARAALAEPFRPMAASFQCCVEKPESMLPAAGSPKARKRCPDLLQNLVVAARRLLQVASGGHRVCRIWVLSHAQRRAGQSGARCTQYL